MATQKSKAKKAAKSTKPSKAAKAKKPIKAATKIVRPAKAAAPKHSPLAIRVAAMLGVGIEEAIERAVHTLAEKLGLHNVGGAQSHAQGGPANLVSEVHQAPAPTEAQAAPAAKPAAGGGHAIGHRPAKSEEAGDDSKSSAGKLIPRHELDLTPLPARTSSASSPTLQYSPTSLPRRLYLELDGRMPLEVVDLPCTMGSSRRNTIWINSPRIETHHAQIVETDEGWVFEDLGSEHGTVFDGEKIQRRVLQNGDTFLLAGYLRMKAELR